MADPDIPKDEQIEAILHGREWELAMRYGLAHFDEIPWTVSKREVKAYIDRHGFPEGWVRFSEQTYDGVYVLPDGDAWTVFRKERGAAYDHRRFPSHDAAMDHLLDAFFLKPKGL